MVLDMRIIKNISKQILSVIFLFSIVCYAQDSSKIIILSERVGHIVDAEEMNYYGILPSFKEGFVSATYYLRPDSQYCCLVKFDNGKTVKDTLLILSYNTIKNTAFRVQTLEGIISGVSKINTSLKFVNEEEVPNLGKLNQDLKSKTKKETIKFIVGTNKLPIKRENVDYSKIIDKKVRYGFSTGIYYNTVSFSNLGKIFNFLEENVPEAGYIIPKSNMTFNSSPIFKLSSVFLLDQNFLLEFSYGSNLAKETNEYLNHKTFTGSIGYLLPIYKYTKAFCALAYSAIEFKAYKKYSVLVNSYQGTLESIALVGKAKGLKASMGIKYSITAIVSLDIRASYNFFPDVNVKEKHMNNTVTLPRVEVKGFEFGINLCFITY